MNVSGISFEQGGEGVVVFASQLDNGTLHIIICNHEMADTNVTVELSSVPINVTGATVARIDDTHANAYTAWQKMGSPAANASGQLDPQVISVLHDAAKLVDEPLSPQDVRMDSNTLCLRLSIPHHGIARVKLNLPSNLVIKEL